MYEEILYVGDDIEPSSLQAQNNVMSIDVVCTDQLAVGVNDLCPA